MKVLLKISPLFFWVLTAASVSAATLTPTAGYEIRFPSPPKRVVCLPPATEAAPGAALKRLPWFAATLAVFLHATFLLLVFWLGGVTGGTHAESLPRFISVSLNSWPSEGETGRHEAVLSKKSALPSKSAARQNRVAASVRTEIEISKENLFQNSGGLAAEGTRLAQPAADGNGLASQAPSAQGNGIAEGPQGTLPEVLARPLYAVNPPPLYPRLARRLGKQGIVLLEVFVSASGMVTEVKVATGSSHEILDKAALETVRGWRFAPGLRNGQPASMWVRVPVRFSLRDGN